MAKLTNLANRKQNLVNFVKFVMQFGTLYTKIMLECRIAAEDKKIIKVVKKSRVCHNLATWRCIFAAQLKNYEYEYRFECKRRSAVDADSVD